MTYPDFQRSNSHGWSVWLGAPTVAGWGPKVAELASGRTYPARAGRWSPGEATRERGIQALVTAESIAPHPVENDVFVREAIADLLPSTG